MRISVLINNYNYGQFLAECVESVLLQSHKAHEIIVVDDGSTDESATVLGRFSEQITIIFQENGGQGSAYNAGFAASSGDIVLFLDSDDTLSSGLLEALEAAFRPESVVKVQWRMRLIDDRSCPLGGVFPENLDSGDVRGIIQRFGMYGSPPGSGNAFRRSSIKRFFPMDVGQWRIAADTVPIVVAPFYGEIVTLPTVGAAYRIHDRRNDSDEFVLNNSPSVPCEAVRLAERSRQQVFRLLSSAGLLTSPFPIEMPAQVKLRLISLKAQRSKHPLSNDTLMRILRDGVISVKDWPGFSKKKRVLYLLWLFVVSIAPTGIAKKIILHGMGYSRRVKPSKVST